MNQHHRVRLEKHKVAEIFSGQKFSGHHCYELDGLKQTYRIYRIFPPSAEDEYLTRQVREHFDLVTERECYDWLKTQVYGVALLVETTARRDNLMRQLQEQGLSERYHCHIEVVPTTDNLKEFIDAFPQNSPAVA